MVVLPGPFASAAFDVNLLSSAEWDSPVRSKRIDAVNAVIDQGPSPLLPLDSNGIPIPPVAVPTPKSTGTSPPVVVPPPGGH
jgi:hypothetical protein